MASKVSWLFTKLHCPDSCACRYIQDAFRVRSDGRNVQLSVETHSVKLVLEVYDGVRICLHTCFNFIPSLFCSGCKSCEFMVSLDIILRMILYLVIGQWIL
jgi:hypothetical protein